MTIRAATAAEGGEQGTESVGDIVGTLFGGLAGDIVGFAGNALGAALEEASRERTFSASGTTSFNYYQILGVNETEHRDVRIVPRLRADESLCLVLSAAGTGPAPELTFQNTSLVRARDQILQAWDSNGLPVNPAVYVEAELQRRPDGFRVRPVFIWYRQPLPGAPRRALPNEIHVTFSTPNAGTAESASGATFAVARIQLPPMAAGSVPMFANQLASLAGPVMPPRPTTGSPETTRSTLQAAVTAYRTHLAEVARLSRLVGRTQGDARAGNEDLLAAANAETARLRVQAGRGTFSTPQPVGSTNVTVRFAVVRNANAFGMKLAQALRTRTATAGTALATELTPQTPQQAWSTLDTTYVREMSEVAAAQRALDLARQGSDAQAIFTAEQTLRLQQAEANAAAAAAGRDLPFPGL